MSDVALLEPQFHRGYFIKKRVLFYPGQLMTFICYNNNGIIKLAILEKGRVSALTFPDFVMDLSDVDRVIQWTNSQHGIDHFNTASVYAQRSALADPLNFVSLVGTTSSGVTTAPPATTFHCRSINRRHLLSAGSVNPMALQLLIKDHTAVEQVITMVDRDYTIFLSFSGEDTHLHVRAYLGGFY